MTRIERHWLAIVLALVTGLCATGSTGCGSTQSPARTALTARNVARVSYSVAAISLGTLEDLRVTWMKSTGEHPSDAQIAVAQTVNDALHATHDALERVRPWVENGEGDEGSTKRAIIDSLKALALAGEQLGSVGAQVPPDLLEGLAFAKAALGGVE